MTSTRVPRRRPSDLAASRGSRRRSQAVVVGAVALVALLAGCGGGEEPPGPDSGLVGTAIDECLAAAAQSDQFPVDGPGALTVTAEPDDKGWWAVVARVEVDGGTKVLTCTAATEADGSDPWAASWSVKDE